MKAQTGGLVGPGGGGLCIQTCTKTRADLKDPYIRYGDSFLRADPKILYSIYGDLKTLRNQTTANNNGRMRRRRGGRRIR